MKSKSIIYFTFFILLLHLSSCKKEFVTPKNTCETTFYYGYNDKMYYEKSSTKITIGFNKFLKYEEADAIINRVNYVQKINKDSFNTFGQNYVNVYIKGYRTCEEVARILDILKNDNEIAYANQVLMNVKNNADELYYMDDFLLALKDTADLPLLEKLVRENKVEFLPRPSYSSFLQLRVHKSSDKDALEMANLFMKSGLFIFSQPNFLIRVVPA